MIFQVRPELKMSHFGELKARYLDALEAVDAGEEVEESLTVVAWVRQSLQR